MANKEPIYDDAEQDSLLEREKNQDNLSNGATNSPKSSSPKDLSQAESSGGFYNPGSGSEDEEDENGSYYKGAKDQAKNKLKQQVKKQAKSKAKKWFFATIGGGGMLACLAAILILLASLLIPDFTQHMIEYQFAKAARDYFKSESSITEEEATYKAETPAEQAQVDQTMGSDGEFAEFKNYNPQAVLDKLNATSTETPESFNTNAAGEVTSISNDGISEPIRQEQNFLGADHAADIAPGDPAALDTFNQDFNLNIRGWQTNIQGSINEKEILGDELNDDLVAFTDEDLQQTENENPTEADATVQQESFDKIYDVNAPVDESGMDQIDSASEAAQKDMEACMKDPNCAINVGNTDSLPANVLKDVEDASSSSILQTVGGFLDPLVQFALPACIILSASMTKSGPVIDSNDHQLMRAGYFVDSAGDQEKQGHINGQAAGGVAWKLGQIGQSNVEMRANGETVDTSNEVAPQKGAGGSFLTARQQMDNLGFPDWVTTTFLSAAGSICGVLLSQAAQVFSIVLFGINLFDGISEAASAADGVAASIMAGFKGFFLTVKDTVTNGWKGLAGVAAASLVARFIALNSAGLGTNTTSTGPPFDNAADAGNNLDANELDRLEFFGRPLTNAEANQTQSEATSTQIAINKNKSFVNRYFALSNADSLVSRVGMNVLADLNMQMFTTFMDNLGAFFEPYKWAAKMLAVTKVAAAQNPNVDNQDYYIVQWGWPTDDQNALANKSSYQFLENRLILNKTQYCVKRLNSTGQCVQYIAAKTLFDQLYGACYGMNQQGTTDATTLQETSLGNLLSGENPSWTNGNPAIARDANGNIIDDTQAVKANSSSDLVYTYYSWSIQGAICSPSQLGPSNPLFGDAVYRWRLDHKYINTLNQLTAIQNAQ